MPRLCKVPGCSYKWNSHNRSLHKLPKNNSVQKRILSELGFPDNFEITSQQFHICSAHFSDDSFISKGKRVSKLLIDEPTVEKHVEVKQGKTHKKAKARHVNTMDDHVMLLASEVKPEIKETPSIEVVYLPVDVSDGKMQRRKIRQYCQFCLSEQVRWRSSRCHLNDEFKQKFLDLTGKEVRN